MRIHENLLGLSASVRGQFNSGDIKSRYCYIKHCKALAGAYNLTLAYIWPTSIETI